ncbi:diaminopimelate epimerase, partial [Stomatobaculum longum]
MKFTKMQGLGNDYVYIDCFSEQVAKPEELAIRIADRHFGVGGDGLILICPSEIAPVRMRMFNADGSEGKMCGNGARCVARYAYDHGLVTSRSFDIETGAGIRHAEVGESLVTIDMGEAVLDGELEEAITVDG